MSELSATLDKAWALLTQGITDRGAPARHPVLATASADGAEARILVLRGADRAAATVTLFTDAATSKVAELQADPRATLLVWDPSQRLQIRLRATITMRAGHPEEWAALSDGARAVYGGDPAPGHTIREPEAHRPIPDPTRFIVLTAHLREIETLHLSTPHVRAIFSAGDGFRGRWVAP